MLVQIIAKDATLTKVKFIAMNAEKIIFISQIV